jgi:hypothetical protein
MEDLFYFTQAEVTLEDIERLAHEAGYETTYVQWSTEPWLHVILTNEIYWEWIPIREREGGFDSFEVPAQELLGRYQPLSAFDVTFHPYRPPSLTKLGEFLQLILMKYGGWVGCDTANLEPIYRVDNIEELRYPFKA